MDSLNKRTLEARFPQVEAQHAQLKRAAEERVRESKWSRASGHFDPQPLSRERSATGGMRIVDKPPGDRNDWAEYGLDEHGRPVLERFYFYDAINEDRYYEHADDAIEAYRFQRMPPDSAAPYGLVSVARYELASDGRVERWCRLHRLGAWEWEEYRRVDGQVVEIDHYFDYDDVGEPCDPPRRERYTVTRTPTGEVRDVRMGDYVLFKSRKLGLPDKRPG
jgi:hypothetical protein